VLGTFKLPLKGLGEIIFINLSLLIIVFVRATPSYIYPETGVVWALQEVRVG